MWDQPFHVSAPPTSLDGCGFCNSIVVRLPLNSISDGSEWWLFYNLVVILRWLCEEVSCIYLCCHLDWKPIYLFLFGKQSSPKSRAQWLRILSHWTEFCYISTSNWKVQVWKGLWIDIQLAEQWCLPYLCINIRIIRLGKSYVSLISLDDLWDQMSNRVSHFMLHARRL